MKRQELYNKTVDILVQAYFNDTLSHGICQACAVGNIVAANTGRNIDKDKNWVRDGRYEFGGWNGWWSIVKLGSFTDNGAADVAATGYSAAELNSIEIAFEHCDKGLSDDQYMFNGLMSVIDALDIIHENTDTVITQQSKVKFQKVSL